MNAKHVRTAVGLLLLLSSTPREAAASGYLTARFGMDHGTAATPNAFAVYYNPAALGGTKGTSLVLDGTLVIRSLSYTRGADALSTTGSKTDPNYVSANTGKASLTNFVGLPYLGVTSDLGLKDLRVGYAVYVPFGGSTTWNKAKSWEGSTVAPGAVDGPQRWHNISGSTLSLYNTLAAAYRIADTGVSIGLNGSVVYNNVKTVRARDLSGGDEIFDASGYLLEGRS